MSENVNKPDCMSWEGNLAVNLSVFKKDFTKYLVESEKYNKSDNIKIALFLKLIGNEGRSKYYTWKISKKSDKKFEDVTRAFDYYCNTRKNPVFERFRFYQTVQGSKNFEDFYMTIRKLAQGCEFGCAEEDMIRDFTVLGLRDKVLKQKLMNTSGLTLEYCIQECRIHDMSKVFFRERLI